MGHTPRSRSQGQKSQGILIWNIKDLALNVQKLLVHVRLKFSKNGSYSKVKVTVSKIMVPTERSYHKEYSCAYIKALAFFLQKLLTRLRLKFRRDWQNDRMTDRTKTIWPLIFDLGGIKKKHVWEIFILFESYIFR